MKAITPTDFRSKLKDHLDLVSESEEIIVIARSGNRDAVIVLNLKEYNSMVETGHLLSTEANRAKLAESIRQEEAGDTIEFDFDLNET